MEVTLAVVDRSNFEKCIRLRLDPSQTDFTPPVVYSLAEAKVDASCVPLAIEAGGAVVGFAMYQRDPEAPALAPATYWIMRFMIDAEHQRRGYGRAALGLLLERLKALPDCTGAALSYHPDNGVAKSFYAGFGFVEDGPVPWGEIEATLRWT